MGGDRGHHPVSLPLAPEVKNYAKMNIKVFLPCPGLPLLWTLFHNHCPRLQLRVPPLTLGFKGPINFREWDLVRGLRSWAGYLEWGAEIQLSWTG